MGGTGECERSGSGTFTVKAHTARATGVTPRIDPFSHRWSVLVPLPPNAATEMMYVSAPGTVTREDNTTQNPPQELPSCPHTQSGCGTAALTRPKLKVYGQDRRHVIVAFRASRAFSPSGHCLVGRARSWGDEKYAGDRFSEGDMRVKMPSASALRRRVLTFTRTSHKTTGGDDNSGVPSTDDVTRTVTLTFRRR